MYHPYSTYNADSAYCTDFLGWQVFEQLLEGILLHVGMGSGMKPLNVYVLYTYMYMCMHVHVHTMYYYTHHYMNTQLYYTARTGVVDCYHPSLYLWSTVYVHTWTITETSPHKVQWDVLSCVCTYNNHHPWDCTAVSFMASTTISAFLLW